MCDYRPSIIVLLDQHVTASAVTGPSMGYGSSGRRFGPSKYSPYWDGSSGRLAAEGRLSGGRNLTGSQDLKLCHKFSGPLRKAVLRALRPRA